ncbi:MAG: methylenetetrahydrofolate reductase [NAD(P)H] [Candidatus Omnitrophota bacterium]|nr:MAG: methylenetetrahydrofolate reductase [NAD(P)H] [Candidatus Omnitrophota bacterium]
MIRKIGDILKEKERTYSFEFFPPKTEKGRKKLIEETAKTYAELGPDWFAVTYGAGGSTRQATMEIVDELQKRYDVPVMHHFTCVGHSKDELKTIVGEMKKRNIRNILALRGDAPEGEKEWRPAPDGLEYCYQLIELIRREGDFFSIGVAGFPEGHVDCPDKETDSKYLKIKIDAGGEFVITQLFFDNKDYFEYLERAKKIGINVRILPGILPITSYQKLLKFCATCGATIPKRVHDIFKPLDGNDEATYKTGVDFAVEQCNDLLKGGSPGLHFYSLNKVEPTREILSRINR